MAVVFLARDTRTGAHLALKLVREGPGHEDREILEAEQRGALLQKQFSAVSSRVPQVYEYGSDGGYFYVAMEYLEGENLSDAIARGPMSAEQALRIAFELCRFVEDAHNFEPEGGERPLRSLLHGDLKPRNIRLTPTGHVKVLDFGIAKALSLSRKVTRNDFGSVAYLSPERLESGDVDQYADLLGDRRDALRAADRRAGVPGARHPPAREADRVARVAAAPDDARAAGAPRHSREAPRRVAVGPIRECARDSAGHRAAHLRDLAAGRAGRLAADADRRAGDAADESRRDRSRSDAADDEGRRSRHRFQPTEPYRRRSRRSRRSRPQRERSACRCPGDSGRSRSGRRPDAGCRQTAIEDAAASEDRA